ncbi:unnamed protein product [Paramecium octaurelia]|uniref:Uncharacterized protein n=1 Tax=Paramecium octaurelia TaxID=43137 RepID=A0A8S1V2B6_PAROT|nr:unnamed protein product [Paramecium octaurelia]
MSFTENSQLCYELGYSFKSKDYSRALALNKDNSILIVGSESLITIYQFKKGVIKEIGRVRKHLNSINVLNFFRNQNCFLSGCSNSNIYYWSNIQCSSKKFIQKLYQHSECINCIILNYPFEDLIISCSDDQKIKFWERSISNSWVCKQTIQEHTTSVNTLSINHEGNTVISCGDDFQILVIEYLPSQKRWQVQQKIQVEKESYRITFINNNLFILQPLQESSLFIYERNNKGIKSEFKKTNQISVRGAQQICKPFFPSVYNPKKNLLICKNGYCLNILSLNQINQQVQQFKLEQVIDCGTQSYGRIFGTVSDDGEFIVIWSYAQKEIQVWACTNKE